MGLATMLISLVSVKSFLIWTIILFLTRTGASFVEITSDSYFFKQVKEEDTDLISFYRITRPLSFILAPILASVIFGILDFKYIFFILGITVIVFGCHYALGLKDTK
jgi:MFS family permease